MADARDCTTVRATVQRAGAGYVRESDSYTVPLEQSIESQGQGAKILSIRDQIRSGMIYEGWTIHPDGSLRYRGRVVVPQLTDLREEILREFHCSRFAVHLGGTKMYCDLHCQYYWRGMKRHVGDFVR